MTPTEINKKLIEDIIINGKLHNSYVCTECDNTSVVHTDNKIQCEYCGNILIGNVSRHVAAVKGELPPKQEKLELIEEIQTKEVNEEKVASTIVPEERKREESPVTNSHPVQRIFNIRQKFREPIEGNNHSRSFREFIPFLIFFSVLFLALTGMLFQMSAKGMTP